MKEVCITEIFDFAASALAACTSFGGGRINKASNTYDINYFITDHLGSTRAIVNTAGEVTAQYNYYPFGKQWEDANSPVSTNRWGYNGKEKQTIRNLNFLDYGARMLETELGRWLSLDPLAIKYYSLSPYAYCANNPLKYIDPDGKKIRGVTYSNGQFSYSSSARKNGTDRYVEARMQTPSGRASITSMVDSKHTYNLIVTDKVLVTEAGNGKYGIVGGLSDGNKKTIIVSTNDATSKTVTQKQLNSALTLDNSGNAVKVNMGETKVTTKDLESPINSNTNNPYQAAYEDSGMKQFDADPNNAYQSDEERINGLGAHEEVHLQDDNIRNQKSGDIYNTEKPAFEAEKEAREEWKRR